MTLIIGYGLGTRRNWCQNLTTGDEAMTEPATLLELIRCAIETEIHDCRVQVTGNGRHFEIDAVSPSFEGKTPVAKKRMVYKAIAHLMGGDDAPVHAIDRLTCSTDDSSGAP